MVVGPQRLTSNFLLSFRLILRDDELMGVSGQLDFTVGAGTKPDRDGSKPDRETEQNRISVLWQCNWLVISAFQAIIGSRPQDTALLESNRSGGLRQRGFCLRAVRGFITVHGPNSGALSPLAPCVKLRGFGVWTPFRMGGGLAGCR